jgi:adenylosuccinate lyase
MAYKRNPMRCERMTGLSRYVLSILSSPFQNAAEQWLERTLDDSANKRLTTPEGFLAVDGILRLVVDVARGLVDNENVIASRVAAELPFMSTEEILMAAATGGRASRSGSLLSRPHPSEPRAQARGSASSGRTKPGDRQELHERIRQHSLAAAREVKEFGRPNDLMARLAADPAFKGVDLEGALDARRFVGRSPEQVDQFLKGVVRPILTRHKTLLGKKVSLSV